MVARGAESLGFDEASRVIRALLADGLLSPGSIVDHGVLIQDVSSRSPCFIVSSDRGPRYFVKDGPDNLFEGRRYLELAQIPELEPYVPAVVRGAAPNGLLVTVAEDDAVNFWAHHLTIGRFPSDLGAAVGEGLGLLHAAHHEAAPPARTPFVFRAHRPHIDFLPALTRGAVEAIRTIQSNPSLNRGLDELEERWRPRTMVHGDLKWPNIILQRRRTQATPPLRLVDWEHSGMGEPAWDLGSALAAYVTFWLCSIQPPRDRSAAALAAAARFPLRDMRPAMGRLWRTYLSRTPVRDVDDLRRLTSQHVAARLVQTALESAVGDVMGGGEALHLQVAANILADPQAAALDLLGLVEDG